MLYRPHTAHPDNIDNSTTFNDDERSEQHGIQHQHEHEHEQRQWTRPEREQVYEQQQRGDGHSDHASAHGITGRTGNGGDELDLDQAELSHLLSVPPETLTSITAHLSPPALLALGCTSAALANHVRAGNTWRRAFVLHFLGISPEGDIDDRGHLAQGSGLGSGGRTILMRRQRESWREEFIWRYIMIRRWSRSKNLPTTHTPLIHSPIAAMHLLSSQSSSNLASNSPTSTSARTPHPALLTASTQYGIVARSFPLQGKVLPGYLDASAAGARAAVGLGLNLNVGPNVNLNANAFNAAWGVGNGNPNGNLNWNGNMNGNPNAQFTPNISACALSSLSSDSPGSSSGSAATTSSAMAFIAWGTRAGEVIFTTAPRAMDSGGAGVRRMANVNVNPNTNPNTNANANGVRVRRCAVGEEHEGSVDDVKWVERVVHGEEEGGGGGRYAVSAGADGRVKLWDARGSTIVHANPHINANANDNSMCLWSSEMIVRKDRLGFVPDACVRAEGVVKAGRGCVVGVVQSGDVHVWVGFGFRSGGGSGVDEATSTPTTTPTTFSAADVREIVVPCPISGNRDPATTVKALYIDPTASAEKVVFLVAYEDDPLFYRVSVQVNDDDMKESHIEVTPFGDPNFGRTSVVVPFFGRYLGGDDKEQESGKSKEMEKMKMDKERCFVLVGDHIGCVSVYAWDAPSPLQTQTQVQVSTHPNPVATAIPIAPLRSFEAHRDGASVTALWWDGLTLVTGSARGTTHVWDGLTFEHLRSFVSPVKRVRGGQHGHQGAGANPNANGEPGTNREAVKHVLVGGQMDVLVVGVGDCVLAWHAGAVSARDRERERGGGVRGRHAPGTGLHAGKKRAAGGMQIRPFEMRQTILESRNMLDSEAEVSRRAYGREREHRAGLDNLGLSEVEAVEYLLMLSRDEANARARAQAEAEAEAQREEGVFEGDFDDDDEDGDVFDDDTSAFGGPSLSSRSTSSSSGSGISSVSSSAGMSTVSLTNRPAGRPIPGPARPRVGPSSSNEKVQISPPYRGEPMQAGEEYLAGGSGGGDGDGEMGVGVEDSFFPPISAGTSPAPSSSSVSVKGKGKGKAKKASKTKNTKANNSVAAEETPKETPAATPKITPKTTPAPTPSGSPSSLKTSAWNVPLTKRVSASSHSSPPTHSSGSGSGSTFGIRSSGISPTSGRSVFAAATRAGAGAGADDEMDADLRFALELSLVEARSRGEDV